MPYPAFTYASGDWTVPYPVSVAVFSRPIPGVNVDYVLRQNFVVRKDNFEALPLNTPYTESFDGAEEFPEWEAFVLVEEGDERDIGGGCVEWTRTFAKVPTTHEEPSTLLYEFPGFYGTWYPPNVTDGSPGRYPFQKVVKSRIQFDYFLLDDDTGIEDLPLEEEQKYEVNSAGSGIYTRFLADAGFVTSPTRAEYEAMVAAGTEIVAQPSQFQRWLGNIIQRQTVYITPQ